MPSNRSLFSRGAALIAAVALGTAGTIALPDAVAAAPKARLGGGSSVLFGHGEVTEKRAATCTLTTIGYDAKGELVGLTNAHCFYDNEGHQWPGDKIYLDESQPGTSLKPNKGANPDLKTGVVGTVAYISGGNPIFPGPNGAGLDYSVIRFDKTKVSPTATVGKTTIKEIGPPPAAGALVCKQGRTTGITCGRMLGVHGHYFSHTIWEMPGDSGSPVTAGTTLVGNQWVTGGSTSMVAIVKDLNTRGQIGAGFTPIAGG